MKLKNKRKARKKVKHYVRFSILNSEGTVECVEYEISSREFTNLPQIPEGSFKLQVFDRTEEGETTIQNIAPAIYFGKFYSFEKMQRKYPEYNGMIETLKSRHLFKGMVKTKLMHTGFPDGLILVKNEERVIEGRII